MRMMVLESEDRMTGVVLLWSVSDMFPPASLFSEDMRAIPALYLELCNVFDKSGVNLLQNSSRRILMKFATTLYKNETDKAAAVEIVKSIISSGRKNQPPRQVTPTQSATQDTLETTRSTFADKISHNMVIWLKDREKKFSGDVGECWQEYVEEYRQVLRDYNLTPAKKLQFWHNLVRGDAKRFYLDSMEGYSTNLEQAIYIIERE